MEDELRASREGEVLKDKYELGERLGSGAMGEVYRARNLLVNRTVAIKILHPELAREPTIVERFLREAKAANLVRHRNIVDVLDIDSDGRGVSFIVQELLEGVDLATHIANRGGRLDADEALALLAPVAEALGAAHARGLVHRDLKPENILLAKVDGQTVPKVLDFGISKLQLGGAGDARPFGSTGANASPRLTAVAGAMGTPAYMSPEQIKDSRSVDARADVWALGVMLYEALSGELPFEAETLPALFAKICSQAPVPLGRRCPDIGRELARVVHRALDPNPALRYADGAALAGALEAARARLYSGEVDSVPPTSRAPGASGAPGQARGERSQPLADPKGWELAVPTPTSRRLTPLPPPSAGPRPGVNAPGAVSIPPGQIADDGLLDWDEVIGVPPALELQEVAERRPRSSPIPVAVGLGPASGRPPRSSPAPFELADEPPGSRRAPGSARPGASSAAPPRTERALVGRRARPVTPAGSIARTLLASSLAIALAWAAPRLAPAGMHAAVELLAGWAALPFAAALAPGAVATVWLLVRAGRGPSAPLLLAALGLGVTTAASAIVALCLAVPGLIGNGPRAVALLAAPWAIIATIGGLSLHAWFWSRDLIGESTGHAVLRWALRLGALGAAALGAWVAMGPRASLSQIADTAKSPAESTVVGALDRIGIVTLGAERLSRAHGRDSARPGAASTSSPSLGPTGAARPSASTGAVPLPSAPPSGPAVPLHR